MQTLRIFISSPGDVSRERQRAREVIESLRRRYAGRLILKPLFWEDLPLQPDMSFQAGIDVVLSGQGVDIAVFILWSRLGSPVGAAIRRPDGGEYRSGTEREYDLMMEARLQSRERGDKPVRPAILVYTRRDEASFEEQLRGKSTAEKKTLLQQKELVESFLQESFKDADTGVNIGAYFPFDRPTTFSERLRKHLQNLLDERVGETVEVGWDTARLGAPYLGLAAFQPEHAPVFFGREEEIIEARVAIKEQALNGCAFLLLSGASGSGKSSLARAGVLPAIVENEIDEQVAAWISLIATPSELLPDLRGALVRRLAGEPLLPSLGSGSSLEDLASGLRENPELTFRLRIKPAIQQLSARHDGAVRLLLVIDQLEELFVASVASEERAAFLNVLEAFARSGSVWIVATVRSDFYQSLQAEPALVRMKSGHGQLDVLPPGPDSLARLIEEPARLAGLSFEIRDGHSLASRILKDASSHAELLPLVEFVLRELYERKPGTSRQLSFADYQALGGVEGALARRAEEVYAGLPVEAQATLGRVLQGVVTLGSEHGAAEKVMRLYSPLARFDSDPAAAALVTAFIEARLFTTGHAENGGEATVSVAHESLFRIWPRAVAWKESNLDFLRTRSRIAARMAEGSPLLADDPLFESAKAFLATRREGFTKDQTEWIAAAVANASRRERQKAVTRNVALASLSLLTIAAVVAAIFAIGNGHAAKVNAAEATRQAGHAESALRESQRQLDRSSLEQGRSWLERGRIAGDHQDPFTALLLAARAKGFENLGRQDNETEQIRNEYPLLIAKKIESDPEQEKARQAELERLDSYIGSVRPRLLPVWASPLNVQHGNTISTVAYRPGGGMLASSSSDGTVKLWDTADGHEIYSFPVATAAAGPLGFSPDGKFLAVGLGDGRVTLWDVSSHALAQTIDKLPGKVLSVKFRPDGRSLVIVSGSQYAKVYDLSAGRELSSFPCGTDARSLPGYSSDGKRMVTGDLHGNLDIWSINDGKKVGHLQSFTTSVGFITWSPDGKWIAASAWGGNEVRIWDAASGKDEPVQVLNTDTAVQCLDFSSDSKRIVAGSEDGSATIWDPGSGHQEAHLNEHAGRITTLTFSPDGEHLASGGWDGRIHECDLATGKNRGTLEGHTDKVAGVDFSPDGLELVSCSWDGLLKLWDTTTGKEIRTFGGRSGKIGCVAFNPDGRSLASGAEDGTVTIWDPSSGKDLQRLQGDAGGVTCLSYDTCGTMLATGYSSHVVKIWDTASGKEIGSFHQHESRISAVAFSPYGNLIASAGRDNHIYLWSPKDGKVVSNLSLDSGESINSLSFESDGWQLVVTTAEGSTQIRNVLNGQRMVTLGDYGTNPLRAVCSRDSQWLITACSDKIIRVWDLSTARLAAAVSGHDTSVCGLAISPDGRHVATSSIDSGIKLWSLTSGRDRGNFEHHDSRISSVDWSHDGTMVVSGSQDASVTLWDPVTCKELASWETAGAQISSVNFSPAGNQVAAGTGAGDVLRWNLPSGRPLAPLKGLHPIVSGTIYAMAFSPDGKLLAVAGGNGNAGIWDASDGHMIKALTGHGREVNGITFTPDGQTIITSSDDGTARLWSTVSGAQMDVLVSQNGVMRALALSGDGQTLAASAGERSIEIWDLKERKLVRVLQGPGKWVSSLAFQPGGKLLAAASSDGMLLLWDFNSGEQAGSYPGLIELTSVVFSPDGGQILVGTGDGSLHRYDVQSGPEPLDLLSLQRQGLFHLQGSQVRWNTSPNLFQSLAFPVDEPHKPEPTGEDARLRREIEALASGGQWCAAIPLWNEAGGNAPASAANRRAILMLWAGSISALPAGGHTVAIPKLASAIAGALTPEAMMDPSVSITVIEGLEAILNDEKAAAGPEVLRLEERFVVCLSDAVAVDFGRRVVQGLNNGGTGKDGSRALVALARRLAAAHPGAAGMPEVSAGLPPE